LLLAAPMPPALVVRWTVGAVSHEGFDALGWSIAGASQVFGTSAEYVVCVNSVAVEVAQRLAGPLPIDVTWRRATADEIPRFMRDRLDEDFAEGVGWKFAPLRIADACRELALDNDCILWRMPDALGAWLEDDGAACVIAEDVRPGFGQFACLCGEAPRNSGMRGLSAGCAYADSLRQILDEYPVTLRSELDEQGLQIAAVMRVGVPLVVTTNEVTICSPFAPHQPHVGSCGAHFVGLNAKRLPWLFCGRPASDVTRDHWRRLKDEVRARIAR
jgi:hypothetical protein